MRERLHILLVDDDREEYLLLKSLIARGGQELGHTQFQLDWVETYAEGLEAYQKEEYDAYLVDYHLGDRSGLDLMQEAAGRGFKAPVILLTGQGSYEVDLAAMEAGAADYLVKDELNLPLLERSIRYAIEQKQAQDRLEGLVQERTRELVVANRDLQNQIARRRLVEDELRESEAKFRTLADTTSAAILIVHDWEIRYANPAVKYVTGYCPEELMGQEVWKIVHPAYQRALTRYGFGGSWEEDIPIRYELKIVTQAGEERWVDVTAGRMDYEGKPAWLLTAFDITERDLAERELRRAKDELEMRVVERTEELHFANQQLQEAAAEAQLHADEMAAMFEAMAEAVTLFDEEGRVVTANRIAIQALGADSTGLSSTELMRALKLRHIDGYPLEEAEFPVQRALNGETVHSWRLLLTTAHGPDMYVSISASPMLTGDRITGAVAVWQDVTEHEHLIEQLEAERLRLKTIVENAPAGILMADSEARLALANPAAKAITGQSFALNEQMKQNGETRICYPDGRPYKPSDMILTRAALDGETHTEVEMLVVTPSGERRFILANATPVRDRKGSLSGAIAMFQDITRRKQADEEIRRRVRELDALQAAAQAMLATLDQDELLREILDAAHKAIPSAEKGLLHLLENGSGALRLSAASGVDIKRKAVERDNHWPAQADIDALRSSQPSRTRRRGFAGKVVREKRPLLVHDLNDEPAYLSKGMPPEMQGIRSVVATPLMLRDECLGSLALASFKTGAFTSSDLRLLEAFAAAASSALQNARLYKEVQRLSMTDTLTELYNRRGLEVVGGQEIEHSRRFNSPLAAVLFDLDHFKEINDTFGHPVGDEVLRNLAHILRGMVRRVDVIGRYGGEEFALLLPENDAIRAVEMAERIRQYFSHTPIETSAGPIIITVSAGVAEASGCALDLNALLECADRALYEAKANGRNRVELA